jgi:hypothetical protein
MKKIWILVLLAALTACEGDRQAELPVFDLEAAMNTGRGFSDAFTLNDIIEVVDIVPIETRPDALIGTASLAHIGKEYYYLVHNDAISRIDHNGKIANTIARQGRGPGEYLEATVVDVNERTSTIRVFDMPGNKYVTYGMDGTTIVEGALDEKGFGLPRFIGNDHMVVRGSRGSSHRLYITDRDMNIMQGLFPVDTTVFDRNERQILTLQTAVGSDGDTALVNLAKEDTLYRVTKREMTPEAVLHKGRYRLPREPLMVVFTPDMPDTYFSSTIVNSVGNYYFIRHLILGQIVQIWEKSAGRLMAHSDSRDGREKFGFRFIFPSGMETRVSSFHFDGDNMAFVIDAVNAAGAIEGLQEDDNPVIIVAKLKAG